VTSTSNDGNAPNLRIDGSLPLSAALVAEVNAFADACEDAGPGTVGTLRLRGVPAGLPVSDEVTVHTVNKWERALRRLERVGIATVAIVEADCGGVAAELLLSSDLRIMAPGSSLRFPETAETAWPGMVLYRLRQQAGHGAARRCALLGLPFPAEEARGLGLVDEVLDPADARVESLLASVATRSGPEFAIRRRLAMEASSTAFEDALGRHLSACDRELRRLRDETPSEEPARV
jgi:isomerase DpgB